jgi:thioredoxin-disulfide reductase
MSADNNFDVIIVGGGAAGLTAAIYTSRRAMKTLLITQDIGGQAATTNDIENYPGTGLITGPDLMNKFKDQAASFGTQFAYAEVTKINRQVDANQTPIFTVDTTKDSFVGQTVILAYGLTHRHLGAPGEDRLGGKGVTYCATCDGPLFKGKTVAVVGGGNSAVDAALFLAKICQKVYLIHRQPKLQAEAILVESLKQPNIELVLSSEIKEMKGESRLSSLVLTQGEAKTEKELAVEGVFINIGYVVNSKLIEGLVDLDQRKQIKISFDAETSQPGIFAAGDITTIAFKQVVISAGWGATAALKAYEYLQRVKGFRGVNIDWGLAKKSAPIVPLT